MNELAWRHHFLHYKYGKFFRHSRAANSVVRGPIWPKFERVWDFMHVLFPARIKMIGSKNNREMVETPFSPYKSMGAFCCHGHQSFDPNCLKTLWRLSLHPVMLHIKFDQDWPTGLRDIEVRKCKIFIFQGQVTPKWVVWSGLKSNRLSFYACPAYQQLRWWFDQKWTS